MRPGGTVRAGGDERECSGRDGVSLARPLPQGGVERVALGKATSHRAAFVLYRAVEERMSREIEPELRELIARLAATKARVALGQIMATTGAVRELDEEDRLIGLCRHQRGDWGNLDEEDREANEQALVEGSRLLSSYTARNGRRFWIITEWDRSVTTILLPEEY